MHQNKPTFWGNSLIGACTAILISLPIASMIGAQFGQTYNTRVLIYSVILFWTIIGACTIFVRTHKNEPNRLSLRFILLWAISVWLWPLLLLLGRSRS